MKNIIERFKEQSIEDILGVKTIDYHTFAELIVRECANIAASAEPWKSDDLILRHFGLKDE